MGRPEVQNTRPDVRVFVKSRPEHAGLLNREATAEARLRQSCDPVTLRDHHHPDDLYSDLARSACGVLVLCDKYSRPRVVENILRFVGSFDPRARPVVFIEASPDDAGAVLVAVQEFLLSCGSRFGFWYRSPNLD